jgi:hypothetical protein
MARKRMLRENALRLAEQADADRLAEFGIRPTKARTMVALSPYTAGIARAKRQGIDIQPAKPAPAKVPSKEGVPAAALERIAAFLLEKHGRAGWAEIERAAERMNMRARLVVEMR